MRRSALLLFLYVLGLCGTAAWAGNVDTYGIGSKATALGGAFAAYADDPFAIYYNPAGLAQIVRPSLALGTHLCRPTIRVASYRVSGMLVPDMGPMDFTDQSSTLVAPHAGFAMPVGPSLVAGIGLYVPYGLDLKWGGTPSDISSYNSYHSWYFREVVTPTLAYRVTDSLAVGVGLSLGKSKGGVDRLAFAPALTNLHNRQVQTDLEDDMNWSVNLGVLYKPTKNIAAGITYRGKTSTRFEGTTMVVGLRDGDQLISGSTLPALASAAQNTSVRTETQIDHPDQVQLGVRYVARGTISIEVDVVWTGWSRVDGYTVSFERRFLDAPLLGPNNPGKTSEYFPRDWKDTTQVRVGLEWQVNRMLTLRGSYFYDPTPIPDTTLDLQWADADKHTFALGAGLTLGKVSVDGVVQYTVTDGKRHIAGESANLNGAYAGGGGTPSTSLSADGHIWGGGMTVNYQF